MDVRRPAVLIIVIFLILPVIASLWVSLSDWSGKGSPLGAHYIGFKNYEALLGKASLSQKNMATATATSSTTCCWWSHCRPSWRWSWR